MSSVAKQSRERPVAVNAKLERAIVLQLLSVERARRRSRAWLAGKLGCDVQALEEALRALCEVGVVCQQGAQVCASPTARRIDELGLIAI
jgi:hypothetical protein